MKALKISNNILKSILNSTGSQYNYNKNDILSLVLGSYSKRAAHYALFITLFRSNVVCYLITCQRK